MLPTPNVDTSMRRHEPTGLLFEKGFKTPGFEFLSNFYRRSLSVPNLRRFPACIRQQQAISTENAYQAAKFPEADSSITRNLLKVPPYQAKQEAKILKRAGLERPDWHEVNVDVMWALLVTKFSHADLRDALLATGSMELIEWNWWRDQFWGVLNSDGKYIGANVLGQLLMHLRDHLRQ